MKPPGQDRPFITPRWARGSLGEMFGPSPGDTATLEAAAERRRRRAEKRSGMDTKVKVTPAPKDTPSLRGERRRLHKRAKKVST